MQAVRTRPAPCTPFRASQHSCSRRLSIAPRAQAEQQLQQQSSAAQAGRRQALAAAVAAAVAAAAPRRAAAIAPDYVQTASGLLVQDITVGTGAAPKEGDVCVVHWAGRTKNYQAKIIDNTSLRDEPYEFRLGARQAIPAFEEAVAGMRVGGVRRIEVLGEIPELAYPRDRSQRFVSGFTYRYGPQPKELGGQRALDFVLDNPTLNDTNRTLLFDIKLLAVRPGRQ